MSNGVTWRQIKKMGQDQSKNCKNKNCPKMGQKWPRNDPKSVKIRPKKQSKMASK
jgi:hypothetical protein